MVKSHSKKATKTWIRDINSLRRLNDVNFITTAPWQNLRNLEHHVIWKNKSGQKKAKQQLFFGQIHVQNLWDKTVEMLNSF